MSAIMIQFPQPDLRVSPVRTSVEVPAAGLTASSARSHAVPPVPAHVPALPAPRVLPAWPNPGTVNLAGELLSLSETTIAYTATITLPETGADFWAMLAAALPADRPE